jgi:hypothetical protein
VTSFYYCCRWGLWQRERGWGGLRSNGTGHQRIFSTPTLKLEGQENKSKCRQENWGKTTPTNQYVTLVWGAKGEASFSFSVRVIAARLVELQTDDNKREKKNLRPRKKFGQTKKTYGNLSTDRGECLTVGHSTAHSVQQRCWRQGHELHIALIVAGSSKRLCRWAVYIVSNDCKLYYGQRK